ncbi:hypothetical protein [Hymenobacter sp. YC55]|uniref:hypothetical protein n=1 Tax=Hymenobacter sp. YC55 TaxID=3034019 RepID=UPI0023F629A7|nr:hypothetical protein [Hymenobacter sp. YC55]MDF7810698.1 hypothetical protein [Hymenobacter sp. YC55]
MKKPTSPQTQVQLQDLIENDLKKRLDEFFASHDLDPEKAEPQRQKLLTLFKSELIAKRAFLFAKPKEVKPTPPLSLDTFKPSTYYNI